MPSQHRGPFAAALLQLQQQGVEASGEPPHRSGPPLGQGGRLLARAQLPQGSLQQA
jgi:hypothetical protein